MRKKTLFLLLLSFLVVTTNCSAKTRNDKNVILERDSLIIKAVGDSIAETILFPQKITAGVLPLMGDSVQERKTISLSSKQKVVVGFIISNPADYTVDTPKYGLFSPQFYFTIVGKKKCTITLKYDFALNKWGVFNSEDKEIIKKDIISTDILRFANILFPDNEFLKTTYDRTIQ